MFQGARITLTPHYDDNADQLVVFTSDMNVIEPPHAREAQTYRRALPRAISTLKPPAMTDRQIFLHLPAGVTREQAILRLPGRDIVRAPYAGLVVKYRSAAESRSAALHEAALLVATMLLPSPSAISVVGAFMRRGEYPAHDALMRAIEALPRAWQAFTLTDPNQAMYLCALHEGDATEPDPVLLLLDGIAERFQR